MSPFLIAAAFGQAAVPPPPAADRDAVCWAASMDGYFRSRIRPDPPPAARDSPEERLREAMGYYLGVLRGRYPVEAALGTAMAAGWAAFHGGDRPRIATDCVTAYGQVLQEVSPLVRPLIAGQRR